MDQIPKHITDHPTISMNQAAAIFMLSPRKFKDKFTRVLQSEIRHAKTDRGIRLLLEDVIRSAYPDAPEGTIYEIAFDYTMRDAIRRKKTWGKHKDRAEEREDNQ